jgi:CHAT domain-containing protein
VAPIATALVPPPEELDPLTLFALHGVLQGVPLAALPVADGWLADLTTVVVHPAGVQPALGDSNALDLRPLFIVDPLQNLASGPQLLKLYRKLFPDGLYLAGAGANRAALRNGLARSSWLHIDAHGQYDPAFPELSRLCLADGPLSLIELAELPMPAHFSNLSGCQTGRWPTIAGSGHYGMAGVLARRGVRWIIASRTTLDDRLARDFNHELYQAVRQRLSVPDAYARASAAVRRHYPPPAWAALLLVEGGRELHSRGQSAKEKAPI